MLWTHRKQTSLFTRVFRTWWRRLSFLPSPAMTNDGCHPGVPYPGAYPMSSRAANSPHMPITDRKPAVPTASKRAAATDTVTGRSGIHPFLSNRALFVAGLLVAALLVEGGLRLADRFGVIGLWQERRTALNDSIWMKSSNPELVYTHRPNYISKGERYTERAGILRPDDVKVQAAPGTFRIAVLGDSVAAAIKLAYPERVFTRLENMLDEHYGQGSVEILNFGVNGYSTLQEAALLDERVDRYSPDMLVLQYCMNDFYPSERPYGWFVDHSPLYSVDFVASLIEKYRAIGYPPVAYWEDQYRQDMAGWRNVENGFAHIARYAAKHDIPVLLVIFPLVSKEGWYAGDAAERHQRVAALGRQSGLSVIDLLPVYAEHDIDTIRLKPYDTFHPNALGQEVAAKALAGWIQDHDYLQTAQQ